VSSVVLIVALAALSLAASSSRVVDFAGGRTSVDTLGEADYVVVKDMRGNVVSESLCDAGKFSDYFVLFIRFKDAVVGQDSKAAVRLVHYPFQVNAPKRLVFGTAASLFKSYAEVFTAEIVQKIQDAQPAAVFCKHGYATLGAGVIWAKPSGVAILDTMPRGGGIANAEPPHAKDLVMRGKITSFTRSGDDPLKTWIVTVKVTRMISGEFSGETFQFAVESPWRSGLKKLRSYTIEAVWNGEGYDVDPLQWRKGESEHRSAPVQ